MIYRVLDLQATGQNIKRLCDEQGISAEQLRHIMGVESVQSCYKWFSAKNLPELSNLIILSKVLEVPIEQILVTRHIDIDNKNKEE